MRRVAFFAFDRNVRLVIAPAVAGRWTLVRDGHSAPLPAAPRPDWIEIEADDDGVRLTTPTGSCRAELSSLCFRHVPGSGPWPFEGTDEVRDLLSLRRVVTSWDRLSVSLVGGNRPLGRGTARLTYERDG